MASLPGAAPGSNWATRQTGTPPQNLISAGNFGKVCINCKMLSTGKTFKRSLSVSALVLAASAAVSAGNAQAVLVLEFLQEGADVRLNVSSSLTGLPSVQANDRTCFQSAVRPNTFRIFGGCSTLPSLQEYPITGPANIGTSLNQFLLSYSGDPFYIWTAFNGFGLPSTYVPGNSISGTGLISGESLSSLGLISTTPGAVLGTWTIGSDSIQARIGGGGGAAVPGPLPLFGAAAAFAHSRRLRARLRTGSAPQA